MAEKQSKPEIAVQYVLDETKLETVAGLREQFLRAKDTLRSLGWDLTEFGPDANPDVISANALSCAGRFAAFLAVTFTGTSARQTAVIGRFGGPVGVWYFPDTPWWSMASAGSGIGYLRDEAEATDGAKVAAIWGDPGDAATRERLELFARPAHAAFAMKREKIGLVGGSYYDVMPASNWHPDTLTGRLGPSYVEIDMSLLERACAQVTDARVSSLLEQLEASGFTLEQGEAARDVIGSSARVSLALELLQEQYRLTGVAINCYGGPDPAGYTGVLGRCGASGCLKGHALGSVVIGCESDVVQCAQQLMFKHLLGAVPCMADPWMLDGDGVLLSGTCGGPAELSAAPDETRIARGTLMGLYEVGVLGVCFPRIAPARAIVCRIHGRRLDRMVIATGDFLGSDTETIPGRLCLKVRLDDTQGFLDRGVIGNHYTFLPTSNAVRDVARIEAMCGLMGIAVDRIQEA